MKELDHKDELCSYSWCKNKQLAKNNSENKHQGASQMRSYTIGRGENWPSFYKKNPSGNMGVKTLGIAIMVCRLIPEP